LPVVSLSTIEPGRNRVRLRSQPVHTEREPGGLVQLHLAFDGEPSALWKQRFAEAMTRRFGMPRPERPLRGGRVEADRIVLIGVEPNQQGAAWQAADDAVQDANAGFDDSGAVR
jgi:hypothetical protein